MIQTHLFDFVAEPEQPLPDAPASPVLPRAAQLSGRMAAALVFTIEHGGRLERRTHGCWTYPGAPRQWQPGRIPDWFVMNATIEALVKRGHLKYTAFKTVRGRPVPVAAAVARPRVSR